MSKHVIIGDVHGHDSWKKIVEENPDADKYIFLGDYVDSFSKSSEECARVLLEIIQFKLENPDKVVLILGNHDFHYINGNIRYSGWKQATYAAVHEVYLRHLELFEVLHLEEEALYSHAGLSKTWIHYFVKDVDVREIIGPLSEEVQGFLTSDRNNLSYEYRGLLGRLQFNYITGYSPYGDQTSSSPIWIRPASLISDFWSGAKIQVVGHTQVKHLQPISPDGPGTSEQFTLWMCDSMAAGEYLVWENNEFNVKFINIEK